MMSALGCGLSDRDFAQNHPTGSLRPEADRQRIGVQQPATALTGPDPATKVCRQTATKVNRAQLLVVRCNGLLYGVTV